jgi:Competence protein CoiA-like family
MQESNQKYYDWANDVTNIRVHITDAKSGKNGYFCRDCGLEMVAKKGNIKVHHFAHDAKDILIKGKCTFSNETERHKVAKEILQRIKKIKVPTVKKYPTKGQKGSPNKIKDSEIIIAHHVEIQLSFYENELGKIGWGRDIDFDCDSTKKLLIRPDAAFFDDKNEPILLIELVATHKVDTEKMNKIYCLGIDTIEVKIPRETPAEIEKVFYTTSNTEWLYNNEREQTTYVPVFNGEEESISASDEFQKRIYESIQSYSCRAVQINDFIRSIRKLVESEQFRAAKRGITSEIRRVEENTEREKLEQQRIEGELRAEIEKQFESEISGIELAGSRIQGDFDTKRIGIEARHRGLEERYHTEKQRLREKDSRIYSESRDYKPSCQPEIERLTKYFDEQGIGTATFDKRVDEIRRNTERSIRKIRAEEENLDTLINGFEGEERAIKERRNYFPTEFGVHEKFFRDGIAERKSMLGVEFEALNTGAVADIKKRNSSGNSEYSKGIRDIVHGGALLRTIKEENATLNRIKRAKESLESKSYKNWV